MTLVSQGGHVHPLVNTYVGSNPAVATNIKRKNMEVGSKVKILADITVIQPYMVEYESLGNRDIIKRPCHKEFKFKRNDSSEFVGTILRTYENVSVVDILGNPFQENSCPIPNEYLELIEEPTVRIS